MGPRRNGGGPVLFLCIDFHLAGQPEHDSILAVSRHAVDRFGVEPLLVTALLSGNMNRLFVPVSSQLFSVDPPRIHDQETVGIAFSFDFMCHQKYAFPLLMRIRAKR